MILRSATEASIDNVLFFSPSLAAERISAFLPDHLPEPIEKSYGAVLEESPSPSIAITKGAPLSEDVQYSAFVSPSRLARKSEPKPMYGKPVA